MKNYKKTSDQLTKWIHHLLRSLPARCVPILLMDDNARVVARPGKDQMVDNYVGPFDCGDVLAFAALHFSALATTFVAGGSGVGMTC